MLNVTTSKNRLAKSHKKLQYVFKTCLYCAGKKQFPEELDFQRKNRKGAKGRGNVVI